jgi:tRNA (cytidine/uridine-2'-O-)-methyltransferase
MEIVLVHPRIPPNTGSLGRTCAATNSRLVLVEPLGFKLDDRHLKRAGLDYWPHLDWEVLPHWRELLERPGRMWLFSARADRSYTEVSYRHDDRLVFGAEDVGLPRELQDALPDQRLRIPFDNPAVRSLNIAQCGAIALFEARRQLQG